jgi:hypothetical protein
MDSHSTLYTKPGAFRNGNGHATQKVERGAGLALRKLSKSQRAVRAANVYDGIAIFQPTRRQLAAAFGVSEIYIDRARRLPPEKRHAIAEGRYGLSRLNPTARPKPGNGAAIVDDVTLTAMVRAVGIEKTLSIASAVEREQVHQ